jgi:hypothetical protein
MAERVKIGHGPGKPFQLVDGHKNVECKKCHKNDNYRDTRTLCAACHEDRLHKGSLGKDTCNNCHDGGKWSALKFDHDKTNYPLEGHHKEAKCEGCHPARRYKPTPSVCSDSQCHLKDDAHERSLGLKCQNCHSPSGETRFDHNDPKVPDRWHLDGKHQAVRCQGCHPTQKYKPAPTLCQGCHADPAAHRGELGVRCGSCHESEGWKKIHTGHDIYPAKFGGAHDRVRCSECHSQGRILQGMAQMCMVCHQRDDIHHNALGPRCGDCHTQRTWAAPHFEHTRVGCELLGVHRLLACVDCHKAGNYAAVSPTCVACHTRDLKRATAAGGKVPNHDAFSSCAICHNVYSWARQPLTGMTRPFPGMRESVCR